MTTLPLPIRVFAQVLFVLCFLLTLHLLLATAAHAATLGGGGTMPWATGLTNIKADLTGPTAGVVALIAAAACLAVLVSGGDLGHFFHRLVYLVFACSALVAVASLFTGLGIAGAVVT